MLRTGRSGLRYVQSYGLVNALGNRVAGGVGSMSLRPIAPVQVRMQSQGGNVESNISQTEQASAQEQEQYRLSDEQVDEWMNAIRNLEEEFSQGEYNPATSLAPENQSRVNILEKAMELNKPKFEPTAEQVEEWERLKTVPIPKREDKTLQHVTNMIMRHGKKERAQKILSRALYIVFCQTRKDPVKVLEESLDVLAPLMLVKTFKTGVAKATVVPVPLNQRQRFRVAWKWIVESSAKRSSSDFAVRLGEELVAVYKGNSSGFEKRDSIHKTAIAHRAYINLK